MEKPISGGKEPTTTQNTKPYIGLLFNSREEAEYILEAYGPGSLAMGYTREDGEVETTYRPLVTAMDPEDDMYLRDSGEWGFPSNPWANCPEGWESWGKDPDTDPDAWDMPDSWWGE